jgi:chromosome partitioning protein
MTGQTEAKSQEVPDSGPYEGEPLVISVWGGKGGIGKTTTASETAWLLGRLGTTLLVDADRRQDEGSSKQIYDQLTLEPTYDLAVEEDPRLLARVRKASGYRYVVIDNAPHRDEDKLLACLEPADLVVVPMPTTYLETKGVLNSIRKLVMPSGRPFRVLLTRVPTSGSRPDVTHQALNAAGVPTFRTRIRAYVAHENAQALGIPVVEEPERPNWDKAAEDVHDYVDEILELLGEEARTARKEAAK